MDASSEALYRLHPAGRKICTSMHHKGSRWCQIIDYQPRTKRWVGGEEIVTVLNAWCRACHRIHSRIRMAKARGRTNPYEPAEPAHKGATGAELDKRYYAKLKKNKRRYRKRLDYQAGIRNAKRAERQSKP